MAPWADFAGQLHRNVQNRLSLSASERIIQWSERKTTNSRYLYVMIQQVLIGVLFAGAVVFLTTLIVRSFRSSQGCASGCGKCDTVSFGEGQLAAKVTPKP